MGRKSEEMYLVLRGVMEYTVGRTRRRRGSSSSVLDEESEERSEDSPDRRGRVAELKEGGFICEAPLWLEWQNRGRLNVITQCDVAIVDAARFQKTASKHE